MTDTPQPEIPGDIPPEQARRYSLSRHRWFLMMALQFHHHPALQPGREPERGRFLFLRNLPAPAIPSVAVPLSLAGTSGVMYLPGFRPNTLTRMPVAISTGFAVDDAIVMIENVARYVERGESPLQAALTGSQQIGFTILSRLLSAGVGALLSLMFFPNDLNVIAIIGIILFIGIVRKYGIGLVDFALEAERKGGTEIHVLSRQSISAMAVLAAFCTDRPVGGIGALFRMHGWAGACPADG